MSSDEEDSNVDDMLNQFKSRLQQSVEGMGILYGNDKDQEGSAQVTNEGDLRNYVNIAPSQSPPLAARSDADASKVVESGRHQGSMFSLSHSSMGSIRGSQEFRDPSQPVKEQIPEEQSEDLNDRMSQVEDETPAPTDRKSQPTADFKSSMDEEEYLKKKIAELTSEDVVPPSSGRGQDTFRYSTGTLERDSEADMGVKSEVVQPTKAVDDDFSSMKLNDIIQKYTSENTEIDHYMKKIVNPGTQQTQPTQDERMDTLLSLPSSFKSSTINRSLDKSTKTKQTSQDKSALAAMQETENYTKTLEQIKNQQNKNVNEDVLLMQRSMDSDNLKFQMSQKGQEMNDLNSMIDQIKAKMDNASQEYGSRPIYQWASSYANSEDAQSVVSMPQSEEGYQSRPSEQQTPGSGTEVERESPMRDQASGSRQPFEEMKYSPKVLDKAFKSGGKEVVAMQQQSPSQLKKSADNEMIVYDKFVRSKNQEIGIQATPPQLEPPKSSEEVQATQDGKPQNLSVVDESESSHEQSFLAQRHAKLNQSPGVNQSSDQINPLEMDDLDPPVRSNSPFINGQKELQKRLGDPKKIQDKISRFSPQPLSSSKRRRRRRSSSMNRSNSVGSIGSNQSDKPPKAGETHTTPKADPNSLPRSDSQENILGDDLSTMPKYEDFRKIMEEVDDTSMLLESKQSIFSSEKKPKPEIEEEVEAPEVKQDMGVGGNGQNMEDYQKIQDTLRTIREMQKSSVNPNFEGDSLLYSPTTEKSKLLKSGGSLFQSSLNNPALFMSKDMDYGLNYSISDLSSDSKTLENATHLLSSIEKGVKSPRATDKHSPGETLSPLTDHISQTSERHFKQKSPHQLKFDSPEPGNMIKFKDKQLIGMVRLYEKAKRRMNTEQSKFKDNQEIQDSVNKIEGLPTKLQSLHTLRSVSVN